MKFVCAIVVFSFICLGIAVSEEDKNVGELVIEIIEKCQAKHETSNEDIKKLMLGEFDKGGAGDKAQCQITCMMEEFDTLEKENSEARKTLRSRITDEAKAEEIAETCKNEATGKDDCEKGYKIYMCLKANAHKIMKKN